MNTVLKKISSEELVDLMQNKNNMKIVDVLDYKSFLNERIPGSISIPYYRIGKLAPRLLNKNDFIIVYCESYGCESSTKVALKLMRMGFRNVYDFKGGLQDYREKGFPLEGLLHTSFDLRGKNIKYADQDFYNIEK